VGPAIFLIESNTFRGEPHRWMDSASPLVLQAELTGC
jgi:hypothetical protein